jgi:hypothetical protein
MCRGITAASSIEFANGVAAITRVYTRHLMANKQTKRYYAKKNLIAERTLSKQGIIEVGHLCLALVDFSSYYCRLR